VNINCHIIQLITYGIEKENGFFGMSRGLGKGKLSVFYRQVITLMGIILI